TELPTTMVLGDGVVITTSAFGLVDGTLASTTMGKPAELGEGFFRSAIMGGAAALGIVWIVGCANGFFPSVTIMGETRLPFFSSHQTVCSLPMVLVVTTGQPGAHGEGASILGVSMTIGSDDMTGSDD